MYAKRTCSSVWTLSIMRHACYICRAKGAILELCLTLFALFHAWNHSRIIIPKPRCSLHVGLGWLPAELVMSLEEKGNIVNTKKVCKSRFENKSVLSFSAAYVSLVISLGIFFPNSSWSSVLLLSCTCWHVCYGPDCKLSPVVILTSKFLPLKLPDWNILVQNFVIFAVYVWPNFSQHYCFKKETLNWPEVCVSLFQNGFLSFFEL